MEGVSLYQRMGFRTERELNMALPARDSTEPAQPYEERCMVWTPPNALGGSEPKGGRA